jgi:quinol monooxygenase YgiN
VPATPWKSFASVDQDQEVLATALPLNRLSSTLRFARFVSAIRKQLANTPGLLGYSMLARPLAKRYWTVSIWEDEAALQAFVRENPHQEIMSALAGQMGATRFVRWNARGSEARPIGTRHSVACAECLEPGPPTGNDDTTGRGRRPPRSSLPRLWERHPARRSLAGWIVISYGR